MNTRKHFYTFPKSEIATARKRAEFVFDTNKDAAAFVEISFKNGAKAFEIKDKKNKIIWGAIQENDID